MQKAKLNICKGINKESSWYKTKLYGRLCWFFFLITLNSGLLFFYLQREKN